MASARDLPSNVSLEADGIVHRRVYATVPPKVEYSLTQYSGSLSERRTRSATGVASTWIASMRSKRLPQASRKIVVIVMSDPKLLPHLIGRLSILH
ncbi:MAG: winged helix-turn-helix transcriptional regulator [Deltaproteobacteria bacterium]|nr:MAG: winged helix-turn-helix transcriptional regulator [Deltaproteobacteria bacterium]